MRNKATIGIVLLVVVVAGLPLAAKLMRGSAGVQQNRLDINGPDAPLKGNIKSVDLGGGAKMEFIWCPPGEFMMGSEKGQECEKPVHIVRFAQGFWLGKCEVTKAQWKAVMGTEPWKGQRWVLDDPDSPAEYLIWEDAQAFCRKAGGVFRLPSEAEWEYACRAGTTAEYCFGDTKAHLADYAWYGQDALDAGSSPRPVARKKPNDWGFYDMQGNVGEWCQDWFHESYQGAPTDGSAWERPTSELRVMRGGCWHDDANGCRVAARGRSGLDWRFPHNGMRLLRTP